MLKPLIVFLCLLVMASCSQGNHQKNLAELDKIYGRLDRNSAKGFGIVDNKSFKLLEDKIRNIKIEYQLSKNKVSKQESMSTSLNNIAIRIDLIQSPHLLNRNYLTKTLLDHEKYIDTDKMYSNLMEKSFWRGLDNENAYFSEDHRGFIMNYRSTFNKIFKRIC